MTILQGIARVSNLIFILAISMALFVLSGSPVDAQVGLNVQTQADTFAPTPTVQPPVALKAPAPAKLADCDKLDGDAQIRCRQRFAGRAFPITTTPGLTSQPTTVRFNLILNPTYESNVFKSDQNLHADTSFGLGGAAQVTWGAGEKRPYDLFDFSVASGSARYLQFPSQSLDVVTTFAGYQLFLNAYRGDGTLLDLTNADPSQKKFPSQNQIMIDTLAFGFQNQAIYAPTFHQEKVDFFTPEIILTRQNISLTQDKTTLCVTAQDTKHATPGFCYYADLTLTAGQSFADVPSQQNANVAASAKLGWRIDQTDLVLSLLTTATAKSYEEVAAGGRRDLLLQSGPTITYTPNKSTTVSLALTYNRNYSSLSAAAWSGVVIQPALTIAFQPPSK